MHELDKFFSKAINFVTFVSESKKYSLESQPLCDFFIINYTVGRIKCFQKNKIHACREKWAKKNGYKTKRDL